MAQTAPHRRRPHACLNRSARPIRPPRQETRPGAPNLGSVKRLVTLVAALSLALPVVQWETGLVDRLTAALGTMGEPSATTSHSGDLHVEVPSALQPLIHAFDH